jgi:hypothetical protein
MVMQVGTLSFTLLLEETNRVATILHDRSSTWSIQNKTLKLCMLSFVIYGVVLTFKSHIVDQIVIQILMVNLPMDVQQWTS